MRVILIFLLLSLALLCACVNENDQVYAEAKRCAAEIIKGGDCSTQAGQNAGGQQPAQSQNTNSAQPPARPEQLQSSSLGEPRIYLDATESMRGFVSSQNNTFTRLIESLSYAMPGCRLYKYGIMKGKKATAGGDVTDFANEISFSQELRKPAFYNLDYNEDDLLFDYLAREERPALSVLVTDGVYSARQTELQSGVVKAIDKWIKRGRFLGILIFNSPFDGKLYSENKRAWIDEVHVDARPFYAFVFSPDEKGFRDLREKLSAEFGGMRSLAFPSQAIFCHLSPELKAGLVFKDVWPSTPFYLQMYDGSVFDEKGVAELTYEMPCLPATDYPVTEFSLEVGVDTYVWQQKAFRKAERPAQFDYQYSSAIETAKPAASASPSTAANAGTQTEPAPASGRTQEPKLKLTFHRDAAASYSLYHLNFSLSSKALQPGIRAGSTADDSLPDDANKTYRFYEFISALTAIHLQDKEAVKLPPPLFVALTNK